jgi:hypothetical protein
MGFSAKINNVLTINPVTEGMVVFSVSKEIVNEF